jgi:hypothetical protein
MNLYSVDLGYSVDRALDTILLKWSMWTSSACMFWKGKTSFRSSWTKSHFMKNANCTSCIHITTLSVLRHQTRQTESKAERQSRPSCLLSCHMLTLEKFVAIATQNWVISKLSLTKHLCVHRRKRVSHTSAMLFWSWYLARRENYVFTSLSAEHFNTSMFRYMNDVHLCETSNVYYVLWKYATGASARFSRCFNMSVYRS